MRFTKITIFIQADIITASRDGIMRREAKPFIVAEVTTSHDIANGEKKKNVTNIVIDNYKYECQNVNHFRLKRKNRTYHKSMLTQK
jgi:hypothetical protein